MNTLSEAWPAFTSGGTSLLQHLLARVGEDHVERIVDDGAALGVLMILVDDGLETHADMLRGE